RTRAERARLHADTELVRLRIERDDREGSEPCLLSGNLPVEWIASLSGRRQRKRQHQHVSTQSFHQILPMLTGDSVKCTRVHFALSASGTRVAVNTGCPLIRSNSRWIISWF